MEIILYAFDFNFIYIFIEISSHLDTSFFKFLYLQNILNYFRAQFIIIHL